MTTTSVTRPKPITDAVKAVGTGVSALLGLGQYLLTLNLISGAQVDQIADLGRSVTLATPVLADATSQIIATSTGLVTAVTGLLASFGVAKTAEKRVTPIEAPVDNYGRELAPVDPHA